ncbi:MAG: 4-alpha-glucanotransferase, partial [Treponema sp.]|nr:4-alpha-glucanotransferase [Treponema sp.]
MNILNKRGSGVLMHISSLPGKTGIGTLGKYAYDFVDLLCDANQTYWQILPVGPTGYGDSPYQSYSTYAGNPYFIDFEILEKEGFLQKADYESLQWSETERYVDYGLVYVNRGKVFKIIYENFKKNIPADFNSFCIENEKWLNDYALFMAVK